MYSSIDKPTHEDWINESSRLLQETETHLAYYKEKIKKHQEDGNDGMLRFYCLKLLDANKRLKREQVVLS